MIRLNRLELHGWKTIKHLPGLTLGPLNVLIGANGAGKSNLISFFRLLNWMTLPPVDCNFTSGSMAGRTPCSTMAQLLPLNSRRLSNSRQIRGSANTKCAWSMQLLTTLIFADERFRFSATTSRPALRGNRSVPVSARRD